VVARRLCLDYLSTILLLELDDTSMPFVDELANTISDVAGKQICIRHTDGPVSVKARNFTNDKIVALGWQSKFSLRDGIAQTYPWIREEAIQTKS